MAGKGQSVFTKLCVENVEGFKTLNDFNSNLVKKSKTDEQLCDVQTANEESSGTFEERPKRKQVSKHDKWLPSEFMRKCCLDGSTGELLPKDECDKNIRSMLKSRKTIDYYELLRLSCDQGMTEERIQNCFLACSFVAMMLDREKLTTTDASPPNQQSVQPVGFKLTKAKQVDRVVAFPGNYQIRITDALTPQICARFVMTDVTKAVAMAVREICKTLAERDPFFALYTPPTTLLKKTSYVVLDQKIVDVIADILKAGFELEDSDENKQILLTQIPQSMYYYFDKARQQFNTYHGPGSSIASANDFRDQLNTSPNFRTNRTGSTYVNYIHDDDLDDYNQAGSSTSIGFPEYLNL